MDALSRLLEGYSLDNPNNGKGNGEFEDPALRKLYADLIARGLASEVEALSVGALIEEKDLEDLRHAIRELKTKVFCQFTGIWSVDRGIICVHSRDLFKAKPISHMPPRFFLRRKSIRLLNHLESAVAWGANVGQGSKIFETITQVTWRGESAGL